MQPTDRSAPSNTTNGSPSLYTQEHVREYAQRAQQVGIESARRQLDAFVRGIGGHEGDVSAARLDFDAAVHHLRLNGKEFPDEGAPLPWVPFPLDNLPRPIRAYVQAHAFAMGCDPVMIVMPALAALAASIGNSAKIVIDYTWSEPPTLWTAIIAPSGTAKSPTQAIALQVAHDIELDSAALFDDERARYEQELELWNERKKGKSKPTDPAPIPPHRARFIVEDVTAETVLSVHADNPRGLLLARDELAGWLGSFDRYAKSGNGDAQTWIDMHGVRPKAIDRKSNLDRPVYYVQRPCVCVTGGIQPAILISLLRSSHFDSGFSARLLMAWPPPRTLEWKPGSRGAVREVEDAYRRTLRALHALPVRVERGRVLPAEVGLSSEGVEAFRDFHRWAMAGTGRLPEASPLRAVWSKSPALCARLALSIELADRAAEAGALPLLLDEQTTVRGESVERAARMTKWFLRETIRLYRKMGFGSQNLTGDAERVLRLPETFTRDDVMKVWNVQDPSTSYKRIKTLQQAGLIEKVSHGRYRRVVEEDSLLGSLSEAELLSDLHALPNGYTTPDMGDGYPPSSDSVHLG